MTSSNLGKVAIITGGAGGLGCAMTAALVERGLRVAVVDSNAALLAQVAKKARDTNKADAILPLHGNIIDESSCLSVVEQAKGAFGSVDVLINNAALGMSVVRSDHLLRNVTMTEITSELLDAFFYTNVKGPFLMAKAVIPLLQAKGWGRIVNVTTSLDTMTREGFFPYGPSKAALEACSAIWAKELIETGITVNVLIPGGVANTPMITNENPFGRQNMLPPEIMARPIQWLASPESDGVTGQRFVARLWNSEVSPKLAARQAGAAVAWPAPPSMMSQVPQVR